jgi:hypothetical protein
VTITSIRKRLDRLGGGDKPPFIAWRYPDETPEQARSRWCSEHPDEDPASRLLFVTWGAAGDGADLG